MFRRAIKRESHENTETVSTNKKRNPVRKRPLGDKKDKDAAERFLETSVFGGDDEILEKLDATVKKKEPKIQGKKVQSYSQVTGDGRKPVWEDEDDVSGSIPLSKDRKHEGIRHGDEAQVSTDQYAERLKLQYQKVTSVPKWARLKAERSDTSDEDSDVDSLLKSTGNYLIPSTSLAKGLIEMKKCPDANRESPSRAKLKSVEFHPSAQVILTAGMDQTLNLFQVDGRNNPKIQSVFIDNYPIHSAHFSSDGEQVTMGSKHKSFYYYDMIGGKIVNVPKIKALEEHNMLRHEISPDGRFLVFLGSYGSMHLISAKSKEWIHTLKMNGSVESIAFKKDGSQMFSHGDDGTVYVWDLHSRDCIHKFVDEGCTAGTSVAISHDGRYLACGSYSGVVNIYDTETCLSRSEPRPLKAVMNLTTSCTSSVFNSTTEILAIASSYTEKAIKLVHFPSLTVFSNFPVRTDGNMRIPTCMDFSVNSGYFSLGTQRGKALLYRVKHYGNY